VNQPWQIVYFKDDKGETPVKDFFEQPSDKGITEAETKQFEKRLRWVQERGLDILKERKDVLETLEHEANLYSLRVPSKVNNARVLLCQLPDNNVLVLLHVFKEKRTKDYQKAIKIARKRRDAVLSARYE
jgi:hypothetical protein